MDDATLKLAGEMIARDSRDIELLARLRAHPDFADMMEELEDTATRHAGEIDGLLVQLLRGSNGI